MLVCGNHRLPKRNFVLRIESRRLSILFIEVKYIWGYEAANVGHEFLEWTRSGSYLKTKQFLAKSSSINQ